MEPLTEELAARIEATLLRALESRIQHIAELPANPLGIEFHSFGQLRATTVLRGLVYYEYFSAIRGVGCGCESALDEALAWLASDRRQLSISVSPFDADEALLARLTQHGLRQSRFMSVLYASASLEQPWPDTEVTVRELPLGERDEFVELWMPPSSPQDQPLYRQLVQAEFQDWRCYVADLDGAPAAFGLLYIYEGVAMMASGWTRPEARNRGCQTALLQRRIADAAAAGCDLVFSTATPGSQSQRNMERLGLRTAYTQAIWVTN